MSCIQIRTFATSNIPPIHKDGDTFVFDTESEFDIRLSKFLEELTDFNKIKVDGVLGFDLPGTEKNRLVLNKYVDPHNFTARQNPLVVQVFSSNLHYLRFHDLYVIGYQNKKYQCELRTGSEHWVIAIKDLTLNQINLHDDPIVYEPATITSNNLDDEYIDGENGLRWPMINYGKFAIEGKGLQLQDFRPLVSDLWLIQKAFCQVGWTFRSPILESNYGRRLISYLLDKDFGNDPSKTNNLNVIAQRDSIFNVTLNNNINPLQFTFTKIIQNDGNYWVSSSGYYYGSGIFDVECSIVVNYKKSAGLGNNNAIEFVTLKLELVMRTVNNIEIVIDSYEIDTFKTAFNFAVDQNVQLKIAVSDLQNDIGSIFFFRLSWVSSTGKDFFTLKILDYADKVFIDDENTINLTSLLTINTKQAFLQEGSEFKIQQLLRKDKFTEFLKGVAHLFRAKFETDFRTNTVTMFPSYDTVIWEDEFVEGYFRTNTIKDLTSQVQFESEKIVNPNSNLKRYTKIRFKKGDAAVQELVLKKLNEETGTENDYLSYTVDNGSQYENDTEVLENPYFEPTYNGLVNGLDPTNGTPVNMPFMMSNYDIENPKASYDINPRILYWGGSSSQRHKTLLFAPDGKSFSQIQIFDNPLVFNLPCSWQDSGDQEYSRFIGGSDLNPSYPLKAIRTQNVAYGTRLDRKDLYHYFYQRFIIDMKINSTIDMLMIFSNAQFFNYSFRDAYTFNLLGKTIIARLISIDDFSTCKPISSPAKFIPVIAAFDSCSVLPDSGGETELFCQGNAPTLEITKDGTCYNFGIGGTNVSPITSITYQYKFFGTDTWITGTSICDPENGFDVRAIIDYADDCQTISRYRSVDACGNSPELNATFNYTDNCFTVEVVGIFISPSHTELIEYSFNEVDWFEYMGCEDVGEETNIFIRATISYSDGCPDDELTIELEIPPTEIDCSQITANAECTPEGLFIRTGEAVRSTALDIIQYREVGTHIWLVWDEVSIIDCPFEFRRVIFYCDDACPIYCGPINDCACDCGATFTIACINKILIISGPITTCSIAWSGPSGYTATGNNVAITLEGLYTATITCGECVYEETYTFVMPNAGTGGDFNLDQDGNILV